MRNKSVIKTFELLSGKSLIRKAGARNKTQTYVCLILALRILCAYDETIFWHLFTEYNKSLQDEIKVLQKFKTLYQKLELVKAENAKLKNKPVDISLVGGRFLLYGYMCNDKVKFGTSYTNDTATTEIPQDIGAKLGYWFCCLCVKRAFADTK